MWRMLRIDSRSRLIAVVRRHDTVSPAANRQRNSGVTYTQRELSCRLFFIKFVVRYK